MALFKVISAVSIEMWRPSINVQSISKLGLGIALMAFAVLYTKYMRDKVSLIKPDDIGIAFGNSVTSIKTGLYNLFIKNFNFDGDPYFFNAPDGFWLIGSTLLVCLIFNKVSRPRQNLILMYVAMVSSIVIFGNPVANETRLYMPLFPVFVFIMIGYEGGCKDAPSRDKATNG